MKKLSFNILFLLGVFAFAVPSLQSCNDEPDGDNFYTFTGQMMSEYLTKNAEFSQYAKIVQRAGLMDQLSAYGHYTCFVPNNAAVDAYLASKGKTIDDLTAAECDTIARTHLVDVMYSVTEMGGGTTSTSILPTQNMMRRNLQISRDVDENGNSVVVVNGGSVVYFEHQDDSVENGIMQPVNAVIVNSTLSLASLISKNSEASLYGQALVLTGFADSLELFKDNSYNAEDYPEYIEYKTGHGIPEIACPPADKRYGFTAFLVTDKVLQEKYGVTTMQELYNLACTIYDPMYPEDVAKPEHDFEHLNSPVNPLYRFMAYHLLDRNVQGYNFLNVRGDMGVVKELANTTDWYTTMLPYTMMKVERLNVRAWLGSRGIIGESYINRRYDDRTFIEGVHVLPTVSAEYKTDGINGVYFYVEDILKFDEQIRDEVHNTRIRMDFSTIFPEIMTQNMRMNGDFRDDDTGGDKHYDYSYKHGKNYYFPDGYLKHVKFTDNVNNYRFIYRRPRPGYYSMHGDEMIAKGIFDLTFLVPPVPFEGEWQIRLGFAPMDASQGAARGVCQIYFGEEGDIKAQGIPLNMERRANHTSIYGNSSFASTNDTYEKLRGDQEKLAEDFKILKNKGYYRGPWSIFHNGDPAATDGERFAVQPSTARKVLCTVHMKPGVDYYLRIRNVSTWRPEGKEGMFDYLELVPKSVYGITDGENAEDDL